ncbi:unnamed protein product [Chrysodeixis includens]|uniref:Chemosensory protein n=1 Tax=Chrysodeixis includens TaxID=689277 RepID=A0A9P0BKK3_CHRIL|nr:unnamed protein product [Chrysodeixis includens]
MNTYLVAVLALAACVLAYDEMYDKIDADKIINDDALFTSYINCMLDKGPCSVEHSADFRKLLPEVIATCCAKCTPIQKKNVRKTVTALSEKRPDDFKAFQAKYDPEGKYEKDFAAFVVASD